MNISIIGTGLIGGSMALKLKQKGIASKIIGIDKNEEHLKEAKSLGIKVVALADTNTNPKDIDYLIPGNDDAIRSISIVLTSLADACERGHKSYKDTK